MKRSWWIPTVAAALASGALPAAPPPEPPPPEPEAPREELVFLPPDVVTVSLRIAAGATLGGLLEPHGVSANDVRSAALSFYDLAKIRPDRDLQLTWIDGDPLPISLRYVIDEDRVLVVERFEATSGGEVWSARLDEVEWDVGVDTRDVVVTRSLWEDGLQAGLRPDDLVTLAKIFEYDVDFNTELRAGARFSLVADVATSPGRRPRLQTVHAVRLENGGRELLAVRFVTDGKEGFYHPDGSGFKKPFLRSPLEFSRVTSGFNPGRFHPILKERRPHNGTDLGAPTGTPIRAVADGVVSFAGKSGGHGNHVKLKHDGTYETSYSHLSKIRVKPGSQVRQGDIVGEVGMTGLATGPHLHYQMWKGGKYVDPMKIDLPTTGTLSPADKARFEDAVARWIPELIPAVADSD